MSKLYTQLAEVYQAMYTSFINYDKEYHFYSGLLSKYACKSLLEIGCGTGNLAPFFTKDKFEYIGLDQSDEMIDIATKNNPRNVFIKNDMRNFKLTSIVDACIMTGRTISYLVSNEDVPAAFNSIHYNLTQRGIICFDFIDAERFIPSIDPARKITHRAGNKHKKYLRDSVWSVNKIQPGAFDWAAAYYEEMETGQLVKIADDQSLLRAFYQDELIGFLAQSGFEVKEIINRPSYAFDTIVIVAEKIN